MPGTKLHRAMERSAMKAREQLESRHLSEQRAMDAKHEGEMLRAYSQWRVAYNAAYPNGENVRDD